MNGNDVLIIWPVLVGLGRSLPVIASLGRFWPAQAVLADHLSEFVLLTGIRCQFLADEEHSGLPTQKLTT